MKKFLKDICRTVLPLVLGAFILYWVYRDFDFARAGEVLLHDTDWYWMSFSLLFGVLSHVLRGWRWKLALEPLSLYPRVSNCVDAVFVSYAANLVLPRVGEVSRCGILSRSDGLPFAKTLGTVVTERIIDTVCICLLAIITFLIQTPVFFRFFQQTGTKIPSLLHLFTSPWFYVVLFSVLGALYLLFRLLRILAVFDRVKGVLQSMVEGIMSLRHVSNMPLFIFYTVGIWLCYFLHFYLTFFCFSFSEDLSVSAGLVLFVAGTFAVIVPTPNGAGPWHFAVITMMMLYGIDSSDAGIFALIVHGIQTLLVVLLGFFGWARLFYRKLV